MSLLGLLNQTITIYSQASYNASGREVVGSGVSVKARFQAKNKNIMGPTGAILTIAAIAYVPSTTTVATDDKVSFEGQNYKVYSKYPVVDGLGVTNHVKLELLRWQTT